VDGVGSPVRCAEQKSRKSRMGGAAMWVTTQAQETPGELRPAGDQELNHADGEWRKLKWTECRG
jgi:hypothetical protein